LADNFKSFRENFPIKQIKKNLEGKSAKKYWKKYNKEVQTSILEKLPPQLHFGSISEKVYDSMVTFLENYLKSNPDSLDTKKFRE